MAMVTAMPEAFLDPETVEGGERSATSPISPPLDRRAPTLSDKVAFLQRPSSYGLTGKVECVETHMSWVFLAGQRAYKLKKPVSFGYLDFSTLAKREAACRAELALNTALADGVYIEVAPLVLAADGLALGGRGAVVDWLVVMRRLDREDMLDKRMGRRPPTRAELDHLALALARFRRHARPRPVAPARYLRLLRQALIDDRAILLRPELRLPSGSIRRVDSVLQRALRCRSDPFAARAGRLIDGHGDLRPEHICFDGPVVRIIDRIEFNATLRRIDPLDELAYLDLECERLGSPAAGRRIRAGVTPASGARADEAVWLFYRCYRAMLRARLSIAHLLEPRPRTPAKWAPQARSYLRIAVRDARRLERLLNRPGGW